MVKLLEYVGKKILRGVGIKTPLGKIIRFPEEALDFAKEIDRDVVIKAQVPITGRLKRGAIKFAGNPDEAYKISKKLLSTKFVGFKPDKLLIEEKINFKRELYLGISINYSYKYRCPVIIFSTEGGVDIEEVARREPNKVGMLNINILDEIDEKRISEGLFLRFVDHDMAYILAHLTTILYYDVFRKMDCMAVEINPLVQTDGELVALDCRIVIDDNSINKHPEVEVESPIDINRKPTELELRMWEWETKDPRGTGYFVQLTTEITEPGYIGFHGIGGGGAMLAADALIKRGLKIANYADTSGDPPASKVYRVIKTILSQRGIEGYILAGAVLASQEQWHHAHAIVKAFNELLRDKPGFPVLILIAGNKEREAHDIIRKGLEGLHINYEIYGREKIYDTDFIAERMIALINKYRGEKFGRKVGI